MKNTPEMAVQEVNWFYQNGRKTKGPYTADQIRSLLRTATVGADTLVWREGDEERRPLKEREEFQHWSAPVLEAFVQASEGRDLGPKIRCDLCDQEFSKALTVVRGRKRLCKLCSELDARKAKIQAQSRPKSNGSLPLLAVAAAIALMIGGSFFAYQNFDLPTPFIAAQWANDAPESWPPIACRSHFKDSAGNEVFCGTAFVADLGAKQPVAISASRHLLWSPEDRQKRSSNELEWAINHLAFMPSKSRSAFNAYAPKHQPRTFINGDVMMMTMPKTESVTQLKTRFGPIPENAEVSLIVAPSAPGQEQRIFSGRVIKPGDQVEDGVIAMEDAFVATRLLGAPFVDRNGKLIGVLNGEKPVDLSKVGSRNLLTFVPVNRLKSLMNP